MKLAFSIGLVLACLLGGFSYAQDATEEPEDAIRSYIANIYDRSKSGLDLPGTTYLFFLESGEIVADVVERGDPNNPAVGPRLTGVLRDDALIDIPIFKRTILDIDTIVRVESRTVGRFVCGDISNPDPPAPETSMQGKARAILHRPSQDGEIYLFEMRDGRSIPVYSHNCSGQPNFRLSGKVTEPDSTVVENRYGNGDREWFDMEDILAIYSGSFRGPWN